MYRTVAAKIDYQRWAGTAGEPSRWRHLDQMSRMLDGTFYEHLRYGFYDETTGLGDTIPLEDRRPSSQYHLPRMVARWSARKLWTGRHIPRVSHKMDEIVEQVAHLSTASRFNTVMQNATILGSVGSVAISFRVSGGGDTPQVAFRVWRARDCTPQFDEFNNLTTLRVHLPSSGWELLQRNMTIDAIGNPITHHQAYWWVRDYMVDGEVTYRPPSVHDWNPVTGWTTQGYDFSPALPPVMHDMGFVPAVWVQNLTGTTGTDGIGTWQDAVNISVEIDYLLSQASRGTRYNCAPQLVIVGQTVQEVTTRAPSDYIHLQGSVKTEGGDTVGAGSADLLEMTGNGSKAAMELIDKLRNMALEQIGASRKDPEKLKGVMSGRAMEFLDEDSHDLVMELRSSYGDAALELLRKVLRALAIGSGDPRGLALRWPRLYQPTPEDLAHLIPALVAGATPIQEPLDPVEAAALSSAGGDSGSKGTKSAAQKGSKTEGGRPSVKPTGGKSLGALLTVEEASSFLKMNMDIDLLQEPTELGVSDSDEPVGGSLPPSGEEEAAVGSTDPLTGAVGD